MHVAFIFLENQTSVANHHSKLAPNIQVCSIFHFLNSMPMPKKPSCPVISCAASHAATRSCCVSSPSDLDIQVAIFIVTWFWWDFIGIDGIFHQRYVDIRINNYQILSSFTTPQRYMENHHLEVR